MYRLCDELITRSEVFYRVYVSVCVIVCVCERGSVWGVWVWVCVCVGECVGVWVCV